MSSFLFWRGYFGILNRHFVGFDANQLIITIWCTEAWTVQISQQSCLPCENHNCTCSASHMIHINIFVALRLVAVTLWVPSGLIHSWWRHQIETFSALIAFVRGSLRSPENPFTKARFDVLFDLSQNKRLSKQSKGRWFETPSRSLWCYCNVSFLMLPHWFYLGPFLLV